MLYWKVDVIEELRKVGYSSYKIRKEGILSESTMQKLREGKGLSWDNLERLCDLLNMDISEIVGTDNSK